MPRRRGSGAQGRRGKGKWSMDYTLVKQVRDNAPLRESFFALARRVFGLSFEEWHRAGWWTDRYVPYTMVYRDGSAAANVSVNRIDTVWRGEALRLVQLGTVMTAPAHRGKGLARSLMEAVLDDWGRTCDGVYLYANGTVLEFYPKFGFVPRGSMSAHCRCPPRSPLRRRAVLRGWTWTRRPGARCCCAAMSAPTLSPLCPCWITPAC